MKVWNCIKQFTKKNKKVIGISILAILVIIVAGCTICWIVGRMQESEAFSSDNAMYEQAQIKIEQTFRNLTEAPEGTFDEGDEDDAEQTEQSAETGEIWTSEIQKDGNTYVEMISENSTYYYLRDGKEYVLYYDDMYGIKADDGDWIEMSAEQGNYQKMFDFADLDKIDRKQLERDGNVLKPKEEYYDELFFELMNISEGSRDNYIVDTVIISLEKSHIDRIEVSYWYDSIYYIKQTYQFSYKDIKIDVPKADQQIKE